MIGAIRMVLFLGALVALTTGVLAADVPDGKNDLSATATESYQIRNTKFGDLLRPKDANGADGTQIVLYPAEPWKCMTWKLQPVGETAYHVQNHFTSKTFVVNAKPGETNVIQTRFARAAVERPVWRFTKLPDGLYEITDAASGKALTAITSEGEGVRVVISPWLNQAEQKWKLEKIDPASLTM